MEAVAPGVMSLKGISTPSTSPSLIPGCSKTLCSVTPGHGDALPQHCSEMRPVNHEVKLLKLRGKMSLTVALTETVNVITL